MLQILCLGCLSHFLAILTQFAFKLCAATKNRKQSYLYFEGLRPITVTIVDTRNKCTKRHFVHLLSMTRNDWHFENNRPKNVYISDLVYSMARYVKQP